MAGGVQGVCTSGVCLTPNPNAGWYLASDNTHDCNTVCTNSPTAAGGDSLTCDSNWTIGDLYDRDRANNDERCDSDANTVCVLTPATGSGSRSTDHWITGSCAKTSGPGTCTYVPPSTDLDIRLDGLRNIVTHMSAEGSGVNYDAAGASAIDAAVDPSTALMTAVLSSAAGLAPPLGSYQCGYRSRYGPDHDGSTLEGMWMSDTTGPGVSVGIINTSFVVPYINTAGRLANRGEKDADCNFPRPRDPDAAISCQGTLGATRPGDFLRICKCV